MKGLFVLALAPLLGAAGHGDKKATGIMTIDRSPERYSCHPGFQLEGNMCVQWLEAPLESRCVQGEPGMDGLCLIREPALQSCPLGFADLGGRCLSVERRPLDVFCAGGLTQAGGFCSRSIAVEPLFVCPLSHGKSKGKKGGYGGAYGGAYGGYGAAYGGYGRALGKKSLGKKGGIQDCAEEIAVQGVLVCPLGELHGDQCLIQRSAPCPVYAAKKEHVKKVPVKKTGGKKSAGMYGGAMYGGYGRALGKKDGGKKTSAPVALDLCTVDEWLPAELQCPAGAMRGLGGCVEWRAVELAPFCAEGVLNAATGLCESLVQEPAQRACPAGFEACGGKKSKGKKNKGFADECCRTETAALLTSCPQGTEWAEAAGACVTHVAPLTSCPHGFTPHGNICKQLLTKPPIVEYTVNVASKGATYAKTKKSKGKKY